MNMAQNWEAPFTGMSMGSVAGAFSGFAQVGTETTSVARWNSLMVWEGGTPPTFTLPVTFIALFDPFTEVSGATGGTFGEMFLTSRGMISIPINDLARTMGITGTIDQSAITEEILRKFNQFVKPLLPLHIVFDGLTLYLSVVVNEHADMITLNEISDTEKAYCWFETSDTTSLTGVTSISAPITATPGGTIVKATPTFDRTRADDLLLDSDA